MTTPDREGGSGWVTYYESDNPNGFRTGQRFSVDEPALTVMADGLGGDSLGHWHLVPSESPPRPSVASEKPPYQVPSMAEITALPWNGYMVASTFSGCGGSCLGYRMAGFRVLWASELVPIAAESYRANAPDSFLDSRDIRAVTADEIMAATGLTVGELDLLDGSPPCQPFSTAGKRHKSWGTIRDYGDHKQRADDLFFEYVRLVDGLRPRVFVAENVSGLVKGVSKGYFKRILARLKACGYRVEARLLDAQWLGVPQARQRIIIQGVRDDLGLDPAFPSPLKYRYSVRDALPWLGSASARVGSHFEAVELDPRRPSETVGAAGEMMRMELVEGNGAARPALRRRLSLDDPSVTVLSGGSRDRTDQFWVEQRVVHDTGGQWGRGDVTDRPAPTESIGRGSQNASHFQVQTIAPSRLPAFDGQPVDGLTIVDPERPAPTVTSASSGNDIAPPVERRKFTIAEVKRLCAFPDDFVLVGSYSEQWARLGNAVPPVMMQHIAAAIGDRVLGRAGH